jgi:tetratricopeptide (TPR) repeat protein
MTGTAFFRGDRMRAICFVLALAAFSVSARADDMPDPPGCNDFGGETSVAEAACGAAIAKEADPTAKSVLLYRRAYEIIDQHDFKTYPAAIALLSQAITLFPGNYRALHERAYVYNEFGHWADALKNIDQRITLQPQEYDGYQERAEAKLNLHDVEGARSDDLIKQLKDAGVPVPPPDDPPMK